ncbi:MAG: HAMP domain-containing sensor histidine kinase [Gammaproteobacteria bacterium]
MLRTLYAKLALVLFGLFCIVGGIFLIAALYTAQMYQQEVAQRLNRDLAAHIVEEHVLLRDGAVNQTGLEGLFHDLMIINPSLEFYLLGPDGRILSYSAAPGKVQRDRVGLGPLQKLMASADNLPVLGDDPRNPDRKKAFSVAPIASGGTTQGYIYAILGSEQVDHITGLLKSSFIMREGALAIGAALAFALLAGLLVFAVLTRRLRSLSDSMENFRRQNFSSPVSCSVRAENASDEIDRLSLSFYEMAVHIRAQMERLRETDDLRRELVANVSHDLRTPLASLQGYLETLILKDTRLNDNERREYLDTARRHAEHLSRLVAELFELAKLDAMEIKPNPEPFALAELVHDVTQKFRLPASKKGIDFKVHMTPDTPFAEADIGMIERVLDNLIDNALQHTPQGGTIHLSVAADSGHITVKVKDTGSGIADDELAHIFERFYRKPAPINGDPGGAGLGLAIAQRIVELHGGRISVSSVLNRGSEFNFTLPVHTALSA